MTDIKRQIEEGAQTAFIDYKTSSVQASRPRLISNDYKKRRKVISAIIDELTRLEEGDAFCISVAFITESGLELLLQELRELEKRGVKGKVLTTDYLTFSSPKALKKLGQFKNIEIKMYRVGDGPGFHTKGYIFRKGEIYSIIVGSSNLTGNALTKNKEWNTKVVSTIHGEFARETIIEFNYYWDQAEDISDCIDTYERIYQEQIKISRQQKIVDFETATLSPNEMQVEFTSNLKKIIDKGERRALLISATGTGKTYASAFAIRDAQKSEFKRVLFVVHREQIARQARDSYKRVFGSDRSYGLLSGSHRDIDKDLVFATVQTLSKDDVLHQFDKDAFDMIVIDEVHRAGAAMHQKVLDYFTPRFCLGMTASPERTDGYDIFKLFDYNIAFEIRLQRAMEDDYLCPFHYFGIADFEVDGVAIDEKTEFSKLVVDARVDHIIEQAEYYGYSGSRVKGLIFCSRKDEAQVLSDKFNERGYRTVALSGDTNQEIRTNAIERLVGPDGDDNLDYIFTVDIFNEGVDIPEVNQVIMLRPTQSPVVFVQQLGRGLRKHDDKEFVVIIDFIGNYSNNFMIPMALFGDRSYNKDSVRRCVREGTRILPGESSVNFDQISRQRIYEKINNMSAKGKVLKENYENLKNRLGHIPTLLDFYEHGEIDPLLFLDYKNSYDQFVRFADKEYNTTFSEKQESTLEFISQIVVRSKRIYETLIIDLVLKNGTVSDMDIKNALADMNIPFSDLSYESAIRVITGRFLTGADLKRYENVKIVEETGKGRLVLTDSFTEQLKDKAFSSELDNLIEFGLTKNKKEYANVDSEFVLYDKYTRKDACRLLGWDKDESSTVYGYRVKHNTCPIFVTYRKDEDISESTKYEDHFVDENTFHWYTRSRVRIDSSEVQSIINHEKTGLGVHLFVKKDDDEGSDFYYMGAMDAVDWKEETINDNNGNPLSIVRFIFRMKNEVRSDLYDYITEQNDIKEETA